MAGGSYHDIRTTAGLSRASFYRCIYRGIDAINSCPQLQLKFPFTLSELHQTATDFEGHSAHGIFNGCVGALDGWLCRVRVPSANEAKKVKEYFSGHYQCYGLNIQATCDASCSFTSLSVLCPGGTSDSKAFYSSTTYNLVEQLPEGFYILADNAYCLSSTLLIPYSGREKQDKSKDAFNFFLSQLRIRIEQAFGLLVTKWRVFKKPIELALWRTSLLIESTFRLHNFCIKQRETKVANLVGRDPSDFAPNYTEYLDPLDEGGNRCHTVCQAVLQQLKSDGRRRPQYNVDRNLQNIAVV